MADEKNRNVRNRAKVIEDLFTDPSLMYRNFTCTVKSLTANVYFLKLEDFLTFFKFLHPRQVKEGVKMRYKMLHSQMKTIKDICEEDYNQVNELDNFEEELEEVMPKKVNVQVPVDGSKSNIVQRMI